MGLRQSKKDKTRVQLLEAALELFGRQGFDETTIIQIAAAVEVSPRTLLRYFPTKEDIVVSWVEESMSVFQECLQGRPAEEPVHDALVASARALLSHYESHRDFHLMLERAIASAPQISARKQDMTAKLADQVAATISLKTSAGSQGLLASHVYPHVLFAIIRVVIQHWVKHDGRDDLQGLLDDALALVQFNPDSKAAHAA